MPVGLPGISLCLTGEDSAVPKQVSGGASAVENDSKRHASIELPMAHSHQKFHCAHKIAIRSAKSAPRNARICLFSALQTVPNFSVPLFLGARMVGHAPVEDAN